MEHMQCRKKVEALWNLFAVYDIGNSNKIKNVQQIL